MPFVYPDPVDVGGVTLEQLRAYDGKDPVKQILIAIRGQVYDVSRGRFAGLQLVFSFTSLRVTRVGEARKRALDPEFKEGGQHNCLGYDGMVQSTLIGRKQVLSNSGIASISVVLIALVIGGIDRCLDSKESTLVTALIDGVIGHYACYNGDTWSSELDILCKAEPQIITTFKVVGVDGPILTFKIPGSLGLRVDRLQEDVDLLLLHHRRYHAACWNATAGQEHGDEQAQDDCKWRRIPTFGDWNLRDDMPVTQYLQAGTSSSLCHRQRRTTTRICSRCPSVPAKPYNYKKVGHVNCIKQGVRDDIEVVAVDDLFVDAKYMVKYVVEVDLVQLLTLFFNEKKQTTNYSEGSSRPPSLGGSPPRNQPSQGQAGERTSGAAGPSMDKMEKAPGDAFSRRNPSGPVNQTDSYAQQPHETVSMSLKEIVGMQLLFCEVVEKTDAVVYRGKVGIQVWSFFSGNLVHSMYHYHYLTAGCLVFMLNLFPGLLQVSAHLSGSNCLGCAAGSDLRKWAAAEKIPTIFKVKWPSKCYWLKSA
ncbi:Protein PGR [Zea mays]|uniref:Protein PGR n=1 Tax=Zea mays TaxID=4577 RepID=A0A3L6DBF5_MAIZE|nr:Protein PGR [Zea mays]